MTRYRTLLEAVYRLYEHSGFAMASAVAFSFVISLFPLCIFLGALAGLFGGRELADAAVTQLFEILPAGVANGLAPEVRNIMTISRFDLLTVGGGLSLFFATTAIETLRAALNGAYRVHETRPYPLCLAMSMFFVFVSAASMLVVSWAIVVGPSIAAEFNPSWLKTILDSSWVTVTWRYLFAATAIGVQLFAYHLWLAAGRRRVVDVLPGIILSVVLWLTIAGLYSYYLGFSNYSRFYAGLSQLMIALIFFQVTAIVIILGAELNRGIIELKKMSSIETFGKGQEA